MKGRFPSISFTFVHFCTSQSPICFGLENLWDYSLAGSSPAPGISTHRGMYSHPPGSQAEPSIRLAGAAHKSRFFGNAVRSLNSARSASVRVPPPAFPRRVCLPSEEVPEVGDGGGLQAPGQSVSQAYPNANRKILAPNRNLAGGLQPTGTDLHAQRRQDLNHPAFVTGQREPLGEGDPAPEGITCDGPGKSTHSAPHRQRPEILISRLPCRFFVLFPPAESYPAHEVGRPVW